MKAQPILLILATLVLVVAEVTCQLSPFAHQAVTHMDPAAIEAQLTIAEEQMAEALSEGEPNDPMRLKLHALIKAAGGRFTGPAARFNYLIVDYMQTTPSPTTSVPAITTATALPAVTNVAVPNATASALGPSSLVNPGVPGSGAPGSGGTVAGGSGSLGSGGLRPKGKSQRRRKGTRRRKGKWVRVIRKGAMKRGRGKGDHSTLPSAPVHMKERIEAAGRTVIMKALRPKASAAYPTDPHLWPQQLDQSPLQSPDHLPNQWGPPDQGPSNWGQRTQQLGQSEQIGPVHGRPTEMQQPHTVKYQVHSAQADAPNQWRSDPWAQAPSRGTGTNQWNSSPTRHPVASNNKMQANNQPHMSDQTRPLSDRLVHSTVQGTGSNQWKPAPATLHANRMMQPSSQPPLSHPARPLPDSWTQQTLYDNGPRRWNPSANISPVDLNTGKVQPNSQPSMSHQTGLLSDLMLHQTPYGNGPSKWDSPSGSPAGSNVDKVWSAIQPLLDQSRPDPFSQSQPQRPYRGKSSHIEPPTATESPDRANTEAAQSPRQQQLSSLWGMDTSVQYPPPDPKHMPWDTYPIGSPNNMETIQPTVRSFHQQSPGQFQPDSVDQRSNTPSKTWPNLNNSPHGSGFANNQPKPSRTHSPLRNQPSTDKMYDQSRLNSNILSINDTSSFNSHRRISDQPIGKHQIKVNQHEQNSLPANEQYLLQQQHGTDSNIKQSPSMPVSLDTNKSGEAQNLLSLLHVNPAQAQSGPPDQAINQSLQSSVHDQKPNRYPPQAPTALKNKHTENNGLHIPQSYPKPNTTLSTLVSYFDQVYGGTQHASQSRGYPLSPNQTNQRRYNDHPSPIPPPQQLGQLWQQAEILQQSQFKDPAMPVPTPPSFNHKNHPHPSPAHNSSVAAQSGRHPHYPGQQLQQAEHNQQNAHIPSASAIEQPLQPSKRRDTDPGQNHDIERLIIDPGTTTGSQQPIMAQRSNNGRRMAQFSDHSSTIYDASQISSFEQLNASESFVPAVPLRIA